MASKTVKTCDVFGTQKGVESYYVTIEKNHGDERPSTLRAEVFSAGVDLGPRGLERLLSRVKQGVSKPERRKKE